MTHSVDYHFTILDLSEFTSLPRFYHFTALLQLKFFILYGPIGVNFSLLCHFTARAGFIVLPFYHFSHLVGLPFTVLPLYGPSGVDIFRHYYHPQSLLGLPFTVLLPFSPSGRTVLPLIFAIFHFIAHAEFIILQFRPPFRVYHFTISAILRPYLR